MSGGLSPFSNRREEKIGGNADGRKSRQLLVFRKTKKKPLRE